MPPAVTLGTPNTLMGINIAPDVPNVLIMGRPTACMMDFVTLHPGPPKFHPPNPIVLGNPKVLIGGRPAAFMGSPCACMCFMLTTTPNVIIG